MATATHGSDAPVDGSDGPSTGGRISPWLLAVGLVVMLAGVLFGYDQGVIAGALEGIQKSFHIGSTMTEIITSWVTLGALFGALVAGVLADRLGRRIALLIAAGLFTVGAMLEAFCPGTGVLVVGRLVVGFGVGVASVAAPLYAAEQAPTRWRGRFVSTYQLAIIGGVNVVATLIAVIYVDRFGRRPLLKIGLVGMASSLLVVAICFYRMNQVAAGRGRGTPPPAGGPSAAGIVTLVALVVYIACFAFSLGPIVWTVINEIFPSRVRGRAVAVATAVNWFSAFLVSEFFLTIVGVIGTAGAFLMFAGFSVVAYVWISRRVPETKGRSLEQIQELWDEPDPVAASEAT